jgi:alkylation response protein AidB-like acyl-CoA dehydrogenase
MYGLDNDNLAIVNRAREIAVDVAAPAAPGVDDQARFPTEAVDALKGSGLWGLAVPVEFGGMGRPPRVFAAVVEELAQACGSTAMVYVMHVAATQSIAGSTTLADRNDTLRAIAAGRHLTTLAFSERGSRSQFWAPVSTLVENGNGFVTSANKSWVTSASQADSYVTSAQRPDAESPLESTLYLVRRGAAGVSINGRFDGLGLRGNDSSPVTFDAVHVATEDLLTAHGAGAPMMLEVVLPWFAVGTAAMATGLCRAAVDATARHLRETGFEHDGNRLRDLPNLRARLARMSLHCEQARALLAHTTLAMEQPDDQTPLLVLQSRLSAIDAAVAVSDLAMQACGGAAFSKHLGVERIFRDARAGCVMAPTSDHLHEFIGRALTGLPLF